MSDSVSQQQTEPTAYWAFVSYSSRDAKWGKWFHKRLENYSIPREYQGLKLKDGTKLGKHIRPVFRDRDELSGSSELGSDIENALKRSRFLIVLCSPNSAASKWVNKEIQDFRAIHGDDNVLALIVDGEPNASVNPSIDNALECFPPALRYPMEPLAGDLRADADGKERGFLKILAGIADIGFDDLYRRHERAQRKRRLLLVTVASIIIAALAALSIFAFNQKSIAETQTEEAERQAGIANVQKKEAEKQTQEAERQASIANAQTKIAEKQTEIAETKTLEAKQQTKIAEAQTEEARKQTEEAKKQKALAESNAQETSRKLAQHYQYRANELVNSNDAEQQANNSMRAVVLLTEAMRISEPFRESAVERLKIQTLLNDSQIPAQLFYHHTPQSFHAFHKHIVLTCGEDRTVQLWDTRNDQPIGKALSFDEPLINAVISKDGKLAAIYDAKFTWVIDCATGKIVSPPLEIDSSYQYSGKHKLYVNRPETSQVKFVDRDRIAVMCSSKLKVFDITSGVETASVETSDDHVFQSFIVLDDQHLWVDLKPQFGADRNIQRRRQIVSMTGGRMVREIAADGTSPMIATGTGTAMVFEDEMIYLQQLVDNERLLDFPTKANTFVDATLAPESSVFLAWYKDGEMTHVHLADVGGQEITVPAFEREQIWKMFLLDEQHLLVAYHGRDRRLEIWNFRTGFLKASTPIEDFPDRCVMNEDATKVVFSADERVWFWNLQSGVHRTVGNHLNDIEHLAFVGNENCLSGDGEVIKKWKFPHAEPPKTNITWSRGKFDPLISELAFGDDLIAFCGMEEGKCYVSVYDEKQECLIGNSIHISSATSFHWNPHYFTSDSDFLVVPHRTPEDKKRCFIWDTKSRQTADFELPVPIREVVRIDRSEIVFLGDDNQIHFHSFSDSGHESLELGPLRDGRIQWSPDRRCVVVEGTETAYLIDLKTRSIVFDEFFFWPPNETCWLANEHAVWCIAKKKLCKINWLTGKILIERPHRDSAEDLTCLADQNVLVSVGSYRDGRIKSGASLKFWDLAGSDLGIEIPFSGKQEFYRSADDRFIHVPGVDSFTTVSTTDLDVSEHSDSFLREHLMTATIHIGDNRKYMVVWPSNGRYRVYDNSTLTAVSKPFSVKQRDVFRTSASFDAFLVDGEVMTVSTRELIHSFQTTTGYKINSTHVNDYLKIDKGHERDYRVLKGRRPNHLVLVHVKRNELALVDMGTGDLSYGTASLLSTVVTEQQVDSTNAVVPFSKPKIIRALQELQRARHPN